MGYEKNEKIEENNPSLATKEIKLDLDPAQLSLEALTHLIYIEKLAAVDASLRKELLTLSERQAKVRQLHDIAKAINNATDEKGEIDLKKHPELKDQLEKAKELGVIVDPNKTHYTKLEQERLVENIQMTKEDLMTENEMQLQAVTRLTNERTEVIQLTKSITKPLHDAIITAARAIKGA